MDEHRNGRECDRTVGDDGSFRAAAERPFSRLGEGVKLDMDRLTRTGFSEIIYLFYARHFPAINWLNSYSLYGASTMKVNGWKPDPKSSFPNRVPVPKASRMLPRKVREMVKPMLFN